MDTVTHEQALRTAMQHHREGRFAEAETIYRRLLAIHPGTPELLQLLGVLAHHTGHLEEALALIGQAIAASPGAFHYHNNLGLLLTDMGRLDAAVEAFQTAIRLKPDCAEAFYNLGIAREKAGRGDHGAEAYREALRLCAGHRTAQLNLGNALAAAGEVNEAIAHYRSVLDRYPDHAGVANNLGNLLKDTGRIDEALACYRAAVAHSHEYPEAHSTLIFASFLHPASTPAEIAGELRRWNQIHAAPLRSQWRSHANVRDPERRLRIGYVSPDFRDHVVGRTLLPCFEAHDRGNFEFVCYSGSPWSDSVTDRYRNLSDQWRDTSKLTDEALAEQIRRDRIDILVDLALHTALNRLRTFARRPAPVQVTWLGYPGSTGLEAMDYRITDRYLDPPGQDTAGGFEEPLRLADCWCCYHAPGDSPAPGEAPAVRSGVITFGSFNNFSKINERVLALWAEILRAVEGSRLKMLLKGGLEDDARRSIADRALRFLQERGIGAERIDFMSYYPGTAAVSGQSVSMAYLRRYLGIDIALDPFPYNGMTTTCDALWMGVPVVALVGELSLGRASFSLLSNVGLPELAAASEGEYVRIATELARDIPRLAGLRATLRERMKNSPLLDPTRFARSLEAAYRSVWRKWCDPVERVAPRAFGA